MDRGRRGSAENEDDGVVTDGAAVDGAVMDGGGGGAATICAIVGRGIVVAGGMATGMRDILPASAAAAGAAVAVVLPISMFMDFVFS